MNWGGSDISARSAAFSIPGRKAANWCWRQWSSSKPDSKHSRCFSLENNSTAKLWDETDITLVIISWQSPGKINGGCHIPVESNSRLHQILCCNWVALDDFYSFFFLHQPTDWLLAAGSVESYGDTSAGMIHDLWRHWTTDYNATLFKWLHSTRITAWPWPAINSQKTKTTTCSARYIDITSRQRQQ